MKIILKFVLAFSFIILIPATSFTQSTCGEIVPFASEPVVDGCEVTYEMDLSIGINWILHPGNGLPQSSSVSSHSNPGNVYTHTYEYIQGLIYPNITYYDANWNVICSSFYPITLDCLPPPPPPPFCGLTGPIEVDSCCIRYSFYNSVYATRVTYHGLSGTDSTDWFIRSPSLVVPIIKGGKCEDEPGEYSFTLECLDSAFVVVSTILYTYTIEDCDENAGPRTEVPENNKDLESKKMIRVYPNPVSNRLAVDAQNQIIQNIKLFDINNRLLIEKNLNENNAYNLDLSQIQSSGIYYLHIIADGVFYSKKIIIQK